MSRIAVVTSSPPMVEGGHMVIARSLVQALREAGHAAEIVVTPQNRFGRQASAYLATWLTDLGTTGGEPIDRVISLRYPSYAVRHPSHVCWLNHTMREYYDQWGRFSGGLSPQARLKERVRRRFIHAADRRLLTRNVAKLFVISRTVQERLRIWPELRSTVLYPPAPQRPYRCDGYEDFIFMVSRLTSLKRADLLVQALSKRQAAGIRCVIAGDGEERPRLQALIDRLGLAERVVLTGQLSDAAMLDYLARCRAVAFLPYDEDYGFVTAEAFASRKPVITCRDSGGPTELIDDGVEGFVCDPTAPSVAVAMQKLIADRGLAERMGTSAFARGQQLNWEDVVRQLTA